MLLEIMMSTVSFIHPLQYTRDSLRKSIQILLCLSLESRHTLGEPIKNTVFSKDYVRRTCPFSSGKQTTPKANCPVTFI